MGDGSNCRNCSRGTYRRLGSEEQCTQCPSGWTTLTEKSVSVADCTVRKYQTYNSTMLPAVIVDNSAIQHSAPGLDQ